MAEDLHASNLKWSSQQSCFWKPFTMLLPFSSLFPSLPYAFLPPLHSNSVSFQSGNQFSYVLVCLHLPKLRLSSILLVYQSVFLSKNISFPRRIPVPTFKIFLILQEGEVILISIVLLVSNTSPTLFNKNTYLFPLKKL